MNDNIDYAGLVMLAENNWAEFVELCGEEDDAERTVQALREMAGMGAAAD
ncbi:MAG: hypothetical protein LBD82_07370 [Deltaproteobacteria bacterium]|jgi:hypothetical protein|nr:hypothetical protein [Deltaproteobacteria bacterium]